MLQEYFSGITDPRQQVKVKHNLLEIVVMTICAVLAGCDRPTFCHEVQEYFSAAENAPKQYPEIKQMETRDCGHGRIEKRT